MRVRALSLVFLLTMALGACSSPAPRGGATPEVNEASAHGKPVIALVMKSLANEFFKTMEDGAREHQKQHADEYELLANGIKDELDVAGQIALVEQMIARRVNALVIAPADSKALGPVCKKALDAGIAVVNIDNRLDHDVLKDQGISVPFVGPDNRKGARMAGEHVAAKLQAGDPLAILEGVPAAYNAIQRKLGLDDAVSAAGLVTVASQSAHWEMDKAHQVASAILTEHPGVKALLCANDSMALGAAAAVRAAGRTGQVLVSGFDGISAVRELITKGEILCTVEQHAGQLAAYGIDYALEILNSRAQPADQETPLDLITAEVLHAPAQ